MYLEYNQVVDWYHSLAVLLYIVSAVVAAVAVDNTDTAVGNIADIVVDITAGSFVDI